MLREISAQQTNPPLVWGWTQTNVCVREPVPTPTPRTALSPEQDLVVEMDGCCGCASGEMVVVVGWVESSPRRERVRATPRRAGGWVLTAGPHTNQPPACLGVDANERLRPGAGPYPTPAHRTLSGTGSRRGDGWLLWVCVWGDGGCCGVGREQPPARTSSRHPQTSWGLGLGAQMGGCCVGWGRDQPTPRCALRLVASSSPTSCVRVHPQSSWGLFGEGAASYADVSTKDGSGRRCPTRWPSIWSTTW